AGADINEYLPPNSAVRCVYVATTVYIKHKHELTMDQAEHDVARSVLSDAQCGTVGAQPAVTIDEVAHNAKFGETNEHSLLQNLGVVCCSDERSCCASTTQSVGSRANTACAGEAVPRHTRQRSATQASPLLPSATAAP